jgi:hypothetical protein
MRTRARTFETAVAALTLAALVGCAGEPTAPTRNEEVAPTESMQGTTQATPQILAAGPGWRLLRVTGVALAEDGAAKMVDEELLVGDSLAAFTGAPIPPIAQRALEASFSRLPASERQGPIVVSMAAARQMQATVTPQVLGCEPEDRVWKRTFKKTISFSHTRGNVPGTVTGTVLFTGEATGTPIPTFTFRIHRIRAIFSCVPYAISLRSIGLGGLTQITGRVRVNANFSKAWRDAVTIASPTLFSSIIVIGPVPVLVSIELPIDVGIDVAAAGRLVADVGAKANGSFNVTCQSGSCSATRSATLSGASNATPTIGIGTNARVTVSPGYREA